MYGIHRHIFLAFAQRGTTFVSLYNETLLERGKNSKQSNVSFTLYKYQKADDKIFVCKFSKKNVSSSYRDILYWEFKDYRANSVDLDEVAHYEPPHQDLRCLQIQLFSSLVLKELKRVDPYEKGGKIKMKVASPEKVPIHHSSYDCHLQFVWDSTQRPPTPQSGVLIRTV